MDLLSNETDLNLSLCSVNSSFPYDHLNDTFEICIMEDLDIRKNVYPIMMPIVLAFCLASFLLSSSIVCSLPYVKRPISPTIRLSLSIASANTAFAFVVFTATLVHSYLPFAFEVNLPPCLMLAVEALRMGVILVQVYHLLAVALVHYFGTLKPLQYAYMLTPKCLKILISCLWIFPILSVLIGFSSVPGQGFLSEKCQNNYFRTHGATFRYIWTFIYFGPTVVLVAVYFHIFLILKKRAKNMISMEHRKKLNRNLKTVKTTSLIVGTFLLGWCPAVVAFLLICKECPIQVHDMRISMAIFSSSYLLFILKVFVDTFIYALRLPEIREALRLLFANLLNRSKSKSPKSFLNSSSTRTSNLRSTYLQSMKSHLSYSSIKEKSTKKTPQNLQKKSSTKSFNSFELCPLYTEKLATAFHDPSDLLRPKKEDNFNSNNLNNR